MTSSTPTAPTKLQLLHELPVLSLEQVRHQPFPALKNDLLLRTIQAPFKKHERVPVWAMRQAGRYLPEFREMRAESDFFTVCRTPSLACEVTLQPLRRFPLDAAIIFSDILVIPQAMGLEVQMIKGKGPHFPAPLESPADLARLKTDVNVQEELGYVFDAITLTRHSLQGLVPIFGFCGAPWTIMAYMIEGGGSKTFAKAKTWLFKHPDAAHELLRRVTKVSIDYLVGQVRGGAQILQVFDSWAGELSPHHFEEFSLPYLKEIAQKVKQACVAELKMAAPVPMVVFAKGAHYALATLADPALGGGYDVVGLDWTIEPAVARQQTAASPVSLQGNLDPCLLFGTQERIRSETKRMLEGFGAERLVANLGHGMMPEHTPEALGWFIDAVHEISEEMNRA